MKLFFAIILIISAPQIFAANTCTSLFGTLPAAAQESNLFESSIQSLAVSSLTMTQVRKIYDNKNIIVRKANRYEDEDILQDAVVAVKNQTAAIKTLAFAIREIAIQQKSLVVGLGGSPSVVVAMLQSMNMAAMNLPLSIPYLPAAATHNISKKSEKRILNKTQILDLFTTWQNFLPTFENLQGRPIMLVDYASTGQSLFYAAKLIEAFYRYQGHHVQVHTFGLKDSGITSVQLVPEVPLLTSEQEGRKTWLYKLPVGLSSDMYGHIFKPLSEYPSYTPGYTKPDDLKPRQIYQMLLEFFRKSLSR